MSRTVIIAIYLLAIVATIVAIDIIFFRNRFFERLLANIGIVLVYVAFYLAFLNKL